MGVGEGAVGAPPLGGVEKRAPAVGVVSARFARDAPPWRKGWHVGSRSGPDGGHAVSSPARGGWYLPIHRALALERASSPRTFGDAFDSLERGGPTGSSGRKIRIGPSKETAATSMPMWLERIGGGVGAPAWPDVVSRGDRRGGDDRGLERGMRRGGGGNKARVAR